MPNSTMSAPVCPSTDHALRQHYSHHLITKPLQYLRFIWGGFHPSGIHLASIWHPSGIHLADIGPIAGVFTPAPAVLLRPTYSRVNSVAAVASLSDGANDRCPTNRPAHPKLPKAGRIKSSSKRANRISGAHADIRPSNLFVMVRTREPISNPCALSPTAAVPLIFVAARQQTISRSAMVRIICCSAEHRGCPCVLPRGAHLLCCTSLAASSRAASILGGKCCV
jgi:hypothetical protein